MNRVYYPVRISASLSAVSCLFALIPAMRDGFSGPQCYTNIPASHVYVCVYVCV